MKTILFLTYKSLSSRKLSTLLTILSITLSVTLFLGIERVRNGARESFSNTISKTDLIVGAKSGSLQLLLYTVFRIGNATNNISYETFEKWSQNPAVAWTIPYSLGDSHKGFRVVATNENFFKFYRYRQDHQLSFESGKSIDGIYDVVLGSEVAAHLKYRVGDNIVVSHGYSEGGTILSHDNMPFKVVGVLNRTATPIDRSLYITLEGMEAIHIDWQDGGQPLRGQEAKPETIKKDQIKIGQITSFLVGTKNRIDTLRLQRAINDYDDEPLLAIIPGVALSELWNGISYAEDGLRIVAIFVVIVGLLGMLLAIYNSLNERRREIAVLRANGARRGTIFGLLTLESTLLSFGSAFFGLCLIYILLAVSQSTIENKFGIFIPLNPPTAFEIYYLLTVVICGFLLGWIPAWRAYKNSLVDGLSPKL